MADGRGRFFNYSETAMRVIALLLLAGCASKHYNATDRYLTIEHGTMRFGSAMAQARSHCESLGMATRHLGTQETGFYMVSRFECVPK